jgi:hypothetical protein
MDGCVSKADSVRLRTRHSFAVAAKAACGPSVTTITTFPPCSALPEFQDRDSAVQMSPDNKRQSE